MASFLVRARGAGFELRVKGPELERQFSKSYPTEAEARRAGQRMVNQLHRGIEPVEISSRNREQKPRTIGEAFSLCDEITSGYAQPARFVAADLGDQLLDTFDHDEAKSYVASLKREKHLTPGSIRKRIGALSQMLTWARRKGYVLYNAAAELPHGFSAYREDDIRAAGRRVVDGSRRRRPSAPEMDALLKAAAPDWQVFIKLAVGTAMRLREMFTLQVDQVDLEARCVMLKRTKNGDDRDVPLTEDMVELLRGYLGRRASGRVFPWWDGDGSEVALNRTTSRLSRSFARLCASAGVVGLRWHDLRHEATSALYEAGAGLTDTEVSLITGHRDLRQLRRYGNVRPAAIAEKLDRARRR